MAEPSALARRFIDRGVALDPGQRRAADALDALRLQARTAPAWPLRRPPPQTGAYLWGEPGRGKTMLMDGLFALSTAPAQRIHYHQFLRDLHRGLAQSGGEQANYLPALARRVAAQSRLFCLDEFHLHDIADAILMERFLTVLLEERVLVILTSNYAPEQLLPDPQLHRYALRVIALIQRHMQVLHLDGERDYRYREAAAGEHYLHPCGAEAEQRLRRLLQEQGRAVGPAAAVSLSGRPLPARAQSPDCVWFDFETICLGPRSHLDYLEMSERWHTVIVSDIAQAQLNKADGLRRFIWLVDVLYDRRQRLLLISERPIETMLREVTLSADTHRTLSRLAEMQSASFAAAAPIEMSPLCQ
ncbi:MULTISPECIES: cell division protein ZapE [Chromobacterium]|nr:MULTISPECIES: cell division protein ZapE [Chromobacterium]